MLRYSNIWKYKLIMEIKWLKEQMFSEFVLPVIFCLASKIMFHTLVKRFFFPVILKWTIHLKLHHGAEILYSFKFFWIWLYRLKRLKSYNVWFLWSLALIVVYTIKLKSRVVINMKQNTEGTPPPTPVPEKTDKKYHLQYMLHRRRESLHVLKKCYCYAIFFHLCSLDLSLTF